MSLGKHLAISRPSATYLLHKIRSAMQQAHFKTWLSGLVCVDEGYVGELFQVHMNQHVQRLKSHQLAQWLKSGDRTKLGLFTSNQRSF